MDDIRKKVEQRAWKEGETVYQVVGEMFDDLSTEDLLKHYINEYGESGIREYITEQLTMGEINSLRQNEKKQIFQRTLDDLLAMPDLFDNEHIYELSSEDINKFVSLWTEKRDLPHVLLLSDCVAFDNTDGNCWGENFANREQAISFLHGESYEEIMELENELGM